MCINFQTKRTTLNLWAHICPKMDFRSGFEISFLEILCAPFFRQNGQLWLFGAKFAQKYNLGSKFQTFKTGFGINTSVIPWVPILSQIVQLLIFWPKFGEIGQLHAIFWFKYWWGCCRELGSSRVEVDGAEWSWVHSLVIPFT